MLHSLNAYLRRYIKILRTDKRNIVNEEYYITIKTQSHVSATKKDVRHTRVLLNFKGTAMSLF